MTSRLPKPANTDSSYRKSERVMDVSLVFCGDTMLAPGPLKTDPFSKIREIVRKADVAFCNLETAFGVGSGASPKRHVISSPPENLDFLADCGFQIVNVA